MKGLEELSGDATANIRRRAKRAAKASILIDDGVLYQAFVNVFNTLVENKGYFLGKWQELWESDNLFRRYKAKQFIGIMSRAKLIFEFDVNLYFALVKKITVYDGGQLIVSLLDGTEIECLNN